jgi:hypothetical protein
MNPCRSTVGISRPILPFTLLVILPSNKLLLSPGPSRLCESLATPKRKRPRLFRVMGRQSNSPPPKSAHNQPMFRLSLWEWLRRVRGGTAVLSNGS